MQNANEFAQDFSMQHSQNDNGQFGNQNKHFKYGNRKEKVVLEKYSKLNEILAMLNN